MKLNQFAVSCDIYHLEALLVLRSKTQQNGVITDSSPTRQLSASSSPLRFLLHASSRPTAILNDEPLEYIFFAVALFASFKTAVGKDNLK